MHTEKCKLCISIVSHNQSELVARLLKSLDTFLKTGTVEVEIVITENLYQGNDCKYESVFKIEVIKNLRERGFGANHNSIMSSRGFDYIWILNPDILLIEPLNLCDFIGQAGKISVSSPVVKNQQGTVEDFVRMELNFVNLIKRKLLNFDHADFSEFDWIAGMSLLFTKEAMLQLRGFDENYFMYIEDCDLCRRARKLKIPLQVLQDFVVVHDARRSSRRSFRMFRLHLASLIKYWVKWYLR